MRRSTQLGALALGVHALPLITCVSALRKRWLPALAGVGDPGRVALTFDDGPDPKSTPAFLEALDDLGWKATFFMIGSMVRYAPSLAGEVASAGHEVAVHGDSHRSHLFRTPTDVASDINRSLESTIAATGTEPVWFRPPYGELTTGTLVGAHRAGLRTVLWTSWGRDWRERATSTDVARDVATGLHPGATILLHDSDCTSAPDSWRATLAALPRLAELFDAQGLKPGPLSEHGIC